MYFAVPHHMVSLILHRGGPDEGIASAVADSLHELGAQLSREGEDPYDNEIHHSHDGGSEIICLDGTCAWELWAGYNEEEISNA